MYVVCGCARILNALVTLVNLVLDALATLIYLSSYKILYYLFLVCFLLDNLALPRLLLSIFLLDNSQIRDNG